MKQTPDPLRERIERAAAGLVYSIGSQRPFEFRRFPGVTIPVGRLSPTELASLAGARGGVVSEVSLDDLLAPHLDRDGGGGGAAGGLARRYEALRDEIRASLGEVRVVRHGSGEVRCLVLGNDPATGEIAGVETVSVET